ncbi:uncharacterized protein LOC128952719 [Oppia nitens]|uniref:uncharacterized protein LOC128952719 n=1 Tax=Oppia nitens TaxID=1686743 RepID=UPI0023DACE07|nr:uncharacterized protein LOC128952719 [Oppia nitens]
MTVKSKTKYTTSTQTSLYNNNKRPKGLIAGPAGDGQYGAGDGGGGAEPKKSNVTMIIVGVTVATVVVVALIGAVGIYLFTRQSGVKLKKRALNSRKSLDSIMTVASDTGRPVSPPKSAPKKAITPNKKPKAGK